MPGGDVATAMKLPTKKLREFAIVCKMKEFPGVSFLLRQVHITRLGGLPLGRSKFSKVQKTIFPWAKENNFSLELL